jgi:hypothetical protein
LFSSFPTLGLVTTFVLSLGCGFAGMACVFKLAIDVLVVAAGDSMDPSSPDDGGRSYWTWPRDRIKIAAQMLGLLILAVVFMGLSYVLASHFFAKP